MSLPDAKQLAGLREALPGQVLIGTGRVAYHLRECVGEGGQGWAFRAHWNDPNGAEVLAKVLRPDVVGLDALRRFQQEAEVLRMLSMLPNPHVVRFYDHAVAQLSLGGPVIALPFTVLEFVKGPSLEQVLKSSGALPIARVRRILRHVGQGLDTVHQQKVVHRDLKPSNILLATDASSEVAKVTDFGLVKLVELNLVRTAALAGASLGYAPPEQYERGNKRVSPRTDVFSLAAVAYEMMSGKLAFPFMDGENPLVIVTRILNGVRPQLAKNLQGLPRELARRPDRLEAIDQVIARALSADPAHRHESIRAFVNELDALLAPVEDAENAPKSLVSPFEATTPNDRSFAASSHEPAPTVPRHQSNPHQSNPHQSTPPPAKPELPATLPYGRPHRFPEAVAAQPSSWRFSAVATPPRPLGLRSATISPSGEVAALGPSGLLVWERGQWQPVALPRDLDPRVLRGVTWIDGKELLLFGEGSMLARVSARGQVDVLRVVHPGITFLGACRVPEGDSWVVGEHAYRGSITRSVQVGTTAGVVVRVSKGRVDAFAECTGASSLTAITRAGNDMLACGERGALVRCDADRAELLGNLCHGHLRGIAALPDGTAVTVGVGGHALHVMQSREGVLEAVQTTRDLLSLAVAPDGSAWAGAATARLLRRSGGSWVRMSGDLPSQGNVLAILAHEATVRAVLDDGALVEGRIVA